MLYKLTTTRVYRTYYGGKNIDRVTGVRNPGITRYPEDWLASVTEAFNPGHEVKGEGLSKTEDGKYLADIIAENKSEMIGSDDRMKLLFKMLDSAERLVIQVHPTVEFAKKYFNSDYGKTECWYVLNGGGTVYLGFKPDITKEYWKELFYKQDIKAMLDCLHCFNVHKGDMIFIAGGVPHAIGADCFIAELQEPTDLMAVTERVTPSGVKLPDVKLHGGLGFEKMFDCFNYDGMERAEIKEKYFLSPKFLENGRELLVGSDVTDKFRLEKLTVSGENEFAVSDYGIVLITNGEGTINGQTAKIGDRFFIPFTEKKLSCSGNMDMLVCFSS